MSKNNILAIIFMLMRILFEIIKNRIIKTNLINYKDNTDYQTRINNALAQFIISASIINRQLPLGMAALLMCYNYIIKACFLDYACCESIQNSNTNLTTVNSESETNNLSSNEISQNDNAWSRKKKVTFIVVVVIICMFSLNIYDPEIKHQLYDYLCSNKKSNNSDSSNSNSDSSNSNSKANSNSEAAEAKTPQKPHKSGTHTSKETESSPRYFDILEKPLEWSREDQKDDA